VKRSQRLATSGMRLGTGKINQRTTSKFEYEEPVGALVATETIATMPCLLYLPTKKGKKIAWAEKQNKIAFLFYFLVVAVYFFFTSFFTSFHPFPCLFCLALYFFF
jgi:hypothetical protein